MSDAAHFSYAERWSSTVATETSFIHFDLRQEGRRLFITLVRDIQ